MKRLFSVTVRTDDGRSVTFDDIVARGKVSASRKAADVFFEGEPYYKGTLSFKVREKELPTIRHGGAKIV